MIEGGREGGREGAEGWMMQAGGQGREGVDEIE